MSIFADVEKFHQKFGHPCPHAPRLPDPEYIQFRQKLMAEEYLELEEAVQSGDLSKIAHEGVDLIYVVAGLLVTCGIPCEMVWNTVQRANMQKVPGPGHNGKTKPTKPEGWEDPSGEIRKILAESEEPPTTAVS